MSKLEKLIMGLFDSRKEDGVILGSILWVSLLPDIKVIEDYTKVLGGIQYFGYWITDWNGDHTVIGNGFECADKFGRRNS